MKNLERQTKILIIIFFILLVVSIRLSFKPKSKAISFSLLDSNTINSISKIEIQFFEHEKVNTYEFIKMKDKFFLRENNLNSLYEVKQNAIENFFATLSSLNTAQVFSQTPTNNLFEHQVVVKLFHENNTIILEANFGDIDTLGLNRYLKVFGEKIYIATDMYADFLKQKSNVWIETQIFKSFMKNNSIQAYSVNNQSTVIKNETHKETIENLEAQVSSFYLLDIFPDTTSAKELKNTSKEQLELNFITGSNEEVNLEFYKLESGDYLVFSSLHNAHFIASEYSIEKLFFGL